MNEFVSPIFKQINEKDQKEELPIYIEMYNISGMDNITLSTHQRYLRDKKLYDQLIKKEAKNKDFRKRVKTISKSNNEKRKNSEEKSPNTIQPGFSSPILDDTKRAIESAPRFMRPKLIEEGFDNPDIKMSLECINMIRYVSENDKAKLRKKIPNIIRRGLNDPDFEVQRISAEMIQEAPRDNREELFEIAIKAGLGNVLVQSSLYKGVNVLNEQFSRTPFSKTGSETFLIGGELKDKTIIKKINPKAFLAWQKLYENWQMWQEQGFDYVPIEPIISFRFNNNTKLVDVSSGVLDLDLSSWNNIYGKFRHELHQDKLKIFRILEKTNINHGHEHDKNFCLRLFRDTNGNIDFDKKPRIYLIDFDQAKFI